MATTVCTPDAEQLGELVRTLGSWQRDDAPIQLHPGDLGWSWRSGASTLADSLRTWSRDGDTVAIGFLDSPDVLRMTVSPETWRDGELARDVVADLAAGVLPAGQVSVEVPDGTAVQELLSVGEWGAGDAWTPLRRDLTSPVDAPDLHVEVVETAEQVAACTAVHRSAWGSDQFTDARWHAMAAGAAFADARCLLARAGDGTAVATVTVWSAGPSRPGLIEPLGVHADHRRRGYGAALCVAAAVHLRQLGASSALVCTPSSLSSAVATYRAAGFQPLAERLDRTRGG